MNLIFMKKNKQHAAIKNRLKENTANNIIEPHHFYADKATLKANTVWDEKGLTNEDMDKLLNQNS